MSIPQITPLEAKQILDENPDAVYLDVRSIPEFTQGHPTRAINIPLLHYKSGQMMPNTDFQKITQAVLPKNKKLVVGCKSGGRSQRACEILTQTGYTDLANIDGGFGGNDHEEGWQASGLPVSTENGDGVGYESLSLKVNS